MTSWIRTVLVLAFALTWCPAWAAPCAGFTDVESTSDFCPNVEWLKNRAITLGCTTTQYCPDLPVTRLHMAAFLNRLGTALTPAQLRVDEAPGALALDAHTVVCWTSDFAVTGYPRRAFIDLVLSATAPTDVTLAADLVQSSDGGATWLRLSTFANRGSVVATHWGTVSNIDSVDLEVGQTVRWGATVWRGGAPGTADLSDSRCQMRVLIYSRTGTASPY